MLQQSFTILIISSSLGFSVQGVWVWSSLSNRKWHHTAACGQNDWHMLVKKTLAPNFVFLWLFGPKFWKVARNYECYFVILWMQIQYNYPTLCTWHWFFWLCICILCKCDFSRQSNFSQLYLIQFTIHGLEIYMISFTENTNNISTLCYVMLCSYYENTRTILDKMFKKTHKCLPNFFWLQECFIDRNWFLKKS